MLSVTAWDHILLSSTCKYCLDSPSEEQTQLVASYILLQGGHHRERHSLHHFFTILATLLFSFIYFTSLHIGGLFWIKILNIIIHEVHAACFKNMDREFCTTLYIQILQRSAPCNGDCSVWSTIDWFLRPSFKRTLDAIACHLKYISLLSVMVYAQSYICHLIQYTGGGDPGSCKWRWSNTNTWWDILGDLTCGM